MSIKGFSMTEDLYDAENAIMARDAVELQESKYFEHLIRWMSEANDQLNDESFNLAEELRSSMFQYTVNKKTSIFSRGFFITKILIKKK